MQTSSRSKCVEMAEIMPPEKANYIGHIHGGYLLYLLDRVAYACAVRYCGKNVVTLSIDQVLFKQPIFIGELVTFAASVNFVGRTSMEIGIRVTAENLKTGEVRHTNTCYITMVAIDEQGKPIMIEPLTLETDEEKRRFHDGEVRKRLRLEYQAQHDLRKKTQ